MIRTDFADFPILETERTLLRPLSMKDELSIFRLRTDEDVNKWLGRKKAESLDDARDFIDRIVKLTDARETMFWALSVKENQQFSGTIMLWNLDKTSGKAELGYELLPEYQGMGLMQEVMPAVLRFGFDEMKLKRIEACLTPNNERSVKLLNKFGFNLEGPLESEPEANLVVYSLLSYP